MIFPVLSYIFFGLELLKDLPSPVSFSFTKETTKLADEDFIKLITDVKA